MSAIIPWNDPGAAPCCCEFQCPHNSSPANTPQLELSADEYQAFQSGGTLSVTTDVSFSISYSWSQFSQSGTGSIQGQASYLQTDILSADSCSKSFLGLQRQTLSESCNASGSVGINRPAGCQIVPANTFGFLTFYNSPGTASGNLFARGVYFSPNTSFRVGLMDAANPPGSPAIRALLLQINRTQATLGAFPNNFAAPYISNSPILATFTTPYSSKTVSLFANVAGTEDANTANSMTGSIAFSFTPSAP